MHCQTFNFNNMVTPHRVCREINQNGSHTFVIAPPSPKRVDENEETPILLLESFQRPPFVNFGKVDIGSKVMKSCIVHNPADVAQQLKITKLPKPEDGFTIDDVPITLDAGQKISFNVTWCPDKVGGVRGKIHFVTSFNEKFEVTLIGTAAEKKKLKKRAKQRKRALIPTFEQISSKPAEQNSTANKQTTCVTRKQHQEATNERDRKLEAAAIMIQKNWKGYLARKQFSKMKIAACRIQKAWRSYVRQRKFDRRETYIVDVPYNAASTIQKHWRGYVARKNFAMITQKPGQSRLPASKDDTFQTLEVISSKCQDFSNDRNQRLEAAAIIIQKNWREYLVRTRLSKMELAACKIQKWWRSNVKQRNFHKRHAFVVDVSNNAALVIQKHWRGYEARKNFATQEHSHSRLSAFENGVISTFERISSNPTEPNLTVNNQTTCVIQDSTNERDRKLEASAIMIQKNWKGYLARKQFSKMKIAACRIQKAWRSYVRQRKFDRRETYIVDVPYNAASTIQKHWRGYVARKNFAMITQKRDQSSLYASENNQNCELIFTTKEPNLTLKSQSTCVNRKLLFEDFSNEMDKKLEAAALIIQKNWKGYLVRTRLSKMKLAACRIQKWWRSYVRQRRSERRETFIVNYPYNATASVLKHWIKYKVDKNFAMIAQSPDHSRVDASDFDSTPTFEQVSFNTTEQNLTVKSQSTCVDTKQHQDSTNERDRKLEAAALTIQANWKGYLARKQFSKMKLAACKIQKWWRSYVNQRKSDRRDTFVVDVPYNAASTIQKFWRGYKVRKDFAMIAQKKHYIVPVLQNHTSQDSLQIKDTPALPLGFRTDIAFKKLINYRKFCQLQAALSSLETTTKISPESCCKIASPSTVDTILDIIKSSNRSEPSKLVISHAFSILLSLVKFEKTQDLVVGRRAVIDICIEKAKVHNKVENIFCKCLTLIYLMVVKSSNRDAIISDLKINKNLMSLIALEASFIKSHKKRKISKEIVFYPYWSSAKNVTYEFTDRFTALEHVNYIFKSKLF